LREREVEEGRDVELTPPSCDLLFRSIWPWISQQPLVSLCVFLFLLGTDYRWKLHDAAAGEV